MKKCLSLVLALVMTMSLVTVSAGAKDFTDNGSITYKEAVEVMSAVKDIAGYTDGSFQPTPNLTRGAAAKIICNLILGPTTASALGADTAPYSDVPTTNVFAGYIAYCQKEGIISGYADGTFRPSAPLTGYAFMKMLLGALGYDSAKEGYTGANWSINVAKQAIAIGLDDGNDQFVGQASVNREEAMLYAFNTMKATMVEYGNDTTITVGDVTVSQSGKATEVAQGGYDNNLNKPYLQFAEKYFPDLKMSKGSDDFERPATTWKVKSTKVGTYAETPALTYSDNVALGDIYADLGMSEKDSEAEVYINGEEGDAVAVSKGNELKVADDTQNDALVGVGSTVEVYYDDDNNDVRIVVIDTYAGIIDKVAEATKSKDAYVVVEALGDEPTLTNAEFETEDFEEEDIVLFTYSETADEIKSIVKAESEEGTLTKKVNDKSITVGDTTYKLAIQMAYSDAVVDQDSMTIKSTYTVYLDSYGNAIYVEEEEFLSSDYALVQYAEGEDDQFTTNRARLLTTDGKSIVVNTEKDYSGLIDQIVTYKADDDNVYTLKAVSETKSTDDATDNTHFTLNKGVAKIAVYDDGDSGETDVFTYANSKSVFVVETKDADGDSVYKAYTGINNVPSIKSGAESAAVDMYYYTKTSNMITVAFIDATAEDVAISTSSKDVVYLAGESVSKLITEADANA